MGPDIYGVKLCLALAVAASVPSGGTELATPTTAPLAAPESLAPRAMGFRVAIERAMAFNVEASLTGEDVALARATSDGLRAASSPNLYLQATYTRLDHSRALAGRTLSGRDQVNAFVGVVQPLVAPRLWGTLAEAKGQEHVSWAGHRNARRSAAVGAANAYLDVVVARRGVEVGRSASATDRAHLDIARARMQAGITGRLDVLRAEDELAQSEGQLAASLAALSRSQEQLGVWLGLPYPVDAADDAGLLRDTVATCTPARQTSLPGRADVALTARQLHQAQRIRRNSWLDYMPTLLATGQVFTQDPATPTNPKLGWQVQALAVVPLWDGGARRALQRGRFATERQAAYRLDALERQARSEVRAAVAVLRQSERQLVEASTSAAAAEASVALTVKAYRGGTLGNLEVVDAERRNRDAQIRKASAEDALRRSRLDLVVAAGNFPEPMGEVPEPS